MLKLACLELVDKARSRLTGESTLRSPRFVRRRVSGAMPTLKEDGVKDVMVRQVPLTEMESPRAASSRIAEALEIVMVQPPPPSLEPSWGMTSEIAMKNISATGEWLEQDVELGPYIRLFLRELARIHTGADWR